MKMKGITLLLLLITQHKLISASERIDISKDNIESTINKGSVIAAIVLNHPDKNFSLDNLASQNGSSALQSPEITADGPLTFCEGGKVTLSTTFSKDLNYQWFNNGTLIKNANSNTYSASTSGSYTVKVTDSQNQSSESLPVDVSVNPIPVMPAITINGSSSICEGASVRLSIPASDASPWYQWYLNGNAISGANSSFYNATKGGQYYLQGTFAGCSSNSAPVTIKVNALPSAGISASGPLEFCSGGSVTLTASGGISYNWSSGAVAQSITVTQTGNYTVTVTDVNQCQASAATQVTVNAAPATTLKAINPSCAGSSTGSVDLTVSGGVTPYTFNWSNQATTEDLLQIPAGTYSVKVTGANRCTVTGSVVLNDPAPLALTLTAMEYEGGYNISCYGASNGSLDLSVRGGTSPYSYMWSNGATTEDMSALKAGLYSIKVSDSKGCISEMSTTLTEPSKLVLNSIAASDYKGYNISCFGGNNGSATLNASGGTAPYYYEWNTSPAQYSSTATGLNAGRYIGKVTDINGCSVTGIIILTQPQDLSLITSPDTLLYSGIGTTQCTDISMTNTSGGVAPYAYQWNTGETTSALTVCPEKTTIYIGTVTDANGCQASNDITVEVIDISCGNKSNKISVCLVPPGNPAASHQVCVSPSAVQTLLDHTPSYVGLCGSVNAITFPGISQEFKIGPNPTSGNFTISYTGEEKAVSVEIYNRNGQLVREIHFNENNQFTLTIAMEDALPGIYHVMIKDSNGMKIKSSGLIKQ